MVQSSAVPRSVSGRHRRPPPRHRRALAAAAVAALLGASSLVACQGDAPSTEPSAGPAVQQAEEPTRPPTPEPTPEPDPEPEWPPSGAGACPRAGDLPLRAQLAQTLFLGVDGSDPAAVQALLQRPEPVGGVFVGGTATTVLTDGTLEAVSAPSPGAPVPLLVAVDDEGGRVERIDGVVGSMPSARDLAADGPEAVRAAAEERARAMADLGITVDFAPVVDLGVQPDRGVIGDRAYAPDPAGVVAGAGAFAAALREAGVLPTLKHFPGHGRAVGDSHDERAVTPPWAEVEDLDLEPYRQLLDDGPAAVMVGHLVVPGLSTDPAVPTSLDPVVYRYLREELGVEGLVVTDDLNGMRAVSDLADGGDAAVRALAAGADMALLASPTGVDALLDRLEAATAGGELPRARVAQAADRVLAWKRCG